MKICFKFGLPNKLRNSRGFVSAGTLFFLGIIFALAASLSFLGSSVRNYVLRLGNKDEVRNEASALLYNIEASLQILQDDEADSPQSAGIITITEMYREYDLRIVDVSSGINTRFMSDAFLQHEAIQRVINADPENVLVDYGWAQKNILPVKMKNRIQESFALYTDEALFPLLNNFPLMNIYYMPEELLAAVLRYYEIKDAEEKAFTVKENAASQPRINLADILQVKNDHAVFDVLGYKTAFWKVSFIYADASASCFVEAVFCAIPDKKDAQKIDRYELIERRLGV